MEALLALRSGDRAQSRLVAAVTEVTGRRPLVVGSAGEAEVALLARRPELVVFDVAVVDHETLTHQAAGARLLAWQGTRTSSAAAALLDAGADEVLDVSMSDEELRARIRRCLRESRHLADSAVSVGDLRVDARTRVAEWRGRSLQLTPREMEVLQVLAASHAQPVRREVVYRLVWRWAMPRGDRTVDVNVKRLRAKLERAGSDATITTHPGIGYELRVPAAVTTL